MSNAVGKRAWRDEIEECLGQVRVGRTATASGVTDTGTWMIPTWPVAITTPGDESGSHYWTTRWSIEPGSPVRADRPVEVCWAATVQGREVEGSWWLLPEGEPGIDPEDYPTRVAMRDGGDLPEGLSYPRTRVETVMDPAQAKGALRWLARQGQRAWDHQLPELIEPMVRRAVKALLPRLHQDRAVTLSREDLMQEARTLLLREAARYSSPDRHDASWGTVAHRLLNGDRLARLVRQSDPDRGEVTGCRAKIRAAQREGILGAAPTLAEAREVLGRTGGWSDATIERALGSGVHVGSLDVAGGSGDAPLIETLTEAPGDLLAALEADGTLGEVLAATGLTPEVILPFLVEAGLVEGATPTRPELTAARKAFAAAFAAPGEYPSIPHDRARMEARAQGVLEQVLAGTSSWAEVASTLTRWRSTRYSA